MSEESVSNSVKAEAVEGNDHLMLCRYCGWGKGVSLPELLDHERNCEKRPKSGKGNPATAQGCDERLDLLRRVAEVAPDRWGVIVCETTTIYLEFYNLTLATGGCERVQLWLQGDDREDAEAIILLLDEMEKRNARPELSYGYVYAGEFGFDVHVNVGAQWVRLKYRGATRGLAITKAFVAVMEAVKG